MIIGIDSGKRGGIAFLWDGHPTTFERTPLLGPKGDEDVNAMANMLDLWSCGDHGVPTVVIEALARGAGKSTWTAASVSGRVWGTWVGIIQTLGLPLVVVRSQDWQREMLKGEKTKTYAERKSASLKVAGRLFPTFAPLASVKANDGISDALLIAEYHRRMNVRNDR